MYKTMATKVMYIDSFRILFYFILYIYIYIFLSTYYLHEIVGSFLTVIKKKNQANAVRPTRPMGLL